jgi:hypothetical protein
MVATVTAIRRKSVLSTTRSNGAQSLPGVLKYMVMGALPTPIKSPFRAESVQGYFRSDQFPFTK